jgi:hypothetical protein
MYTTRRGGFDRDDARLHYKQLQTRKLTKLPRVGDKVVMNDTKDAQVYTVTNLYNASGDRVLVKLKYVSEFGKLCDAGLVDASLLLTPLNHS